MAYDEGLAQRIREILDKRTEYVEKKMFGGAGYMLKGNMSVGVIGEDLIVRVGLENYDKALEKPHSRPFDFTGQPMKGWVMVGPDGYEEDEDLKVWVQQGVDFALSLPPK
ncbi:MAG: TfoX/Sxy family protein [Chloroflexi bacterium]|nr:TfoX/Sxy family protein [Chloroflexota bacterium]